ncbi:MAG: molybdopterin-dependent oxidoreductase [Planctomycetes bacterium]|nr:molybdopterin-dependent oxidoreductase [Planctomycetota bacterium]MCB9869067.1 molybdopterin-dependent oxidoreductase [Planctomycetota bacterium]MCB9888025.1 molybdopterin-dependent oxidoreductase [Planctomycetota bacterium]
MPDLRRTTCNRDCPDACGIVATVEHDRITALRGDPDHPVTRGFLCYRTSSFFERLDAPDRLTQPLLRRGGALVPVTVEEALDVAAERLLQIRAESGPAAIFHYRSGGSLGLLKSIADRFFEEFGPVTVKSGDVCNGAGEAAQEADFGVSESNDLFDLRRSRHIVLWGKNPFASNVHLVPLLKEVRAAGATITLIDPVRHKGAGLADRAITPRPDGDLELALGVARALLDRGALDPQLEATCDHVPEFLALLRAHDVAGWAAAAGVAPEVVHELATAFADGPTAILVGWGMQRRGRGGATIRAIDALSAASGNLFRPGGGCSFYFGRRTAFAPLASKAAARHVREPLFGADVLAADPPIRAIWVTAGNPVCMLPDAQRVAAALEATEFVVVVDPFLTDTARRADLVLPVPTLLEDDDLVGAYGHHWLGESRPVVAPPPGVLHEVELFHQLAQRVGLGDRLGGGVIEWKRRLLARLEPEGVTLDSFANGAQRNPFAREQALVAGEVPTPTGRVNLLTARAEPPAEDPDFPLWLFSNSTPHSQASQWAGKGLGERVWVAVHPDAAPGLREGAEVVVRSRIGEVRAELRFDAAQRRDVAIMPKGGHLDRGHAANTLIEARLTDIGLGAAYLDCRVALRAP